MKIFYKLKPLLNNHIYTKDEQFIKDKITIANIIMLVMAPSVFLFSIYRYFHHEYLQTATDIILVLAIISGYLLLKKDKNNFLLVSRILMFFALGVAFLTIIRMSDIETRFTWLILNTYLIFYLLGKNEGRIWFLSVLSIFSFFVFLDIIQINMLEYTVFITVNTILAFFLIQYEKIKDQSEIILLNHTKDLENAVNKKTFELQQQKDTLEFEVQRRTNELLIANRAKGDFLANMSHEIRTPLNAILGFINILKRDEVDSVRKKHFAVVDSSGKTLLTIINDILDFSKIENGKLNMEYNSFDIKKAFEDTYALFYEKAKEKEVSISLNIETTLPENVSGDIVRVKQIASNILSNAIKFTPKKGHISISVVYLKETEYLTCSIKDTGIGISKENCLHIFNSFSQADNSTTRKFGGTGLGLSISKHLVELMEGDINVVSTLEEGTTFTFDILLKAVEESRPKENCIVDEDDIVFNNTGKVLIVEDNKTNQLLLRVLLLDLGLLCDVADNGADGLQKVQEKEYSIVLMDENMPIMNGIESTKKIRELNIKVPIIAVTANALKGDREKFLAAGMNDYISKPIDNDEFIKVLKKYLN